MSRSSLKQMAKNAKTRLRSGYVCHNYSDKSALPSQEKQERIIYEKVKRIILSPEPILNPLGLLIDEEEYKKMSPEQRERYVLELSDMYLRMTERFLKEQGER